ncbi:MAG: DNA topoisomerase I, partial [Spirochaetia bacterium]|nr:DNA topoisomerase I [Spirochaetia bacterium]
MEPAKALIIVESPTKAKTITKFLPSDCKVVASKGHIRDLPEDRMAIDVTNGFACEYQVVSGKEALIKELKSNLKQAQRLLLATDEDREGESISWHLLQVLKPNIPYQRMVFHEITKSAITKALEQGRDLDENLVQAQEGRRVVDRLYGYT